MSRRPWHRRFHEDALGGMQELTLEERGAYNTILDLIYKRGARLEDDDAYLRSQMGRDCSMQRWRKIKARLIALGKLYVEDGYLGNGRTDKELADEIKFHTDRSEAGAIGGKRSGEVRRKKSEKSSEKSSEKPDRKVGRFLSSASQTSLDLQPPFNEINGDNEAVLQSFSEANANHLTSHIESSSKGEPQPSERPPEQARSPATLTGGERATECCAKPTNPKRDAAKAEALRRRREAEAALAEHKRAAGAS